MTKDSIGYTPLHGAVDKGHIKIVRLLCDHGADIEARYIFGLRPLHRTARNGHISAAKELIEVRSADINARDDDGWTALSFARVNGHADVADYLVSHGGIE